MSGWFVWLFGAGRAVLGDGGVLSVRTRGVAQRRRFFIGVSLIQAPLVSPTLFVPPPPMHKDGVDRIHFLNVCRQYVHLIESEVLARMPLGDVTRAECGGCARRTGGEGCVPAPIRRTGAGIDSFVELCTNVFCACVSGAAWIGLLACLPADRDRRSIFFNVCASV